MKKLILTSLVSGFLLTGCGDNMPPECDSKDTKKLLHQVIQQQIDNPYLNLKSVISKFSITGHEMLEEHKKAQEYTCEARVIYTYKNGTQNSELINYSVFLDANKKDQFFVQLIN